MCAGTCGTRESARGRIGHDTAMKVIGRIWDDGGHEGEGGAREYVRAGGLAYVRVGVHVRTYVHA